LNVVIDASVSLGWVFEDESDAYADGVLDALRASEAVAPALWPLEVTNGLLTAERRGRISSAEAIAILRTLMMLPIVVEPFSRTDAFTAVHGIGQKHRLSAYDATYLELARRLGVPLATADRALRDAAHAEGVAIFGM
jgi:predicted nucleic acid-binding protein